MQRGVIALSAVHLASNLFEFHQAAVEIFGMQEKNRLTMGTDFRLSRSQNAGSLCFEVVARCEDVFDLIANVVNSASWIFVKEPLDRRPLPQWIEQFYLGVGQLDEHHRHTMVRFILGGTDICAERISILSHSSLQIRYSDGDMV